MVWVAVQLGMVRRVEQGQLWCLSLGAWMGGDGWGQLWCLSPWMQWIGDACGQGQL